MYVNYCANPKEYIEYFKSIVINKKHKGINKRETTTNIEAFSKRIVTLDELEKEEKEKDELVEQSNFTIKKNEMTLERISKRKFSQLNNKRYYFSCGIVSVPFSHPYLKEINKLKYSKKQKIESVYDQLPQFRDLSSNKRMINNLELKYFSINTRGYILGLGGIY